MDSRVGCAGAGCCLRRTIMHQASINASSLHFKLNLQSPCHVVLESFYDFQRVSSLNLPEFQNQKQLECNILSKINKYLFFSVSIHGVIFPSSILLPITNYQLLTQFYCHIGQTISTTKQISYKKFSEILPSVNGIIFTSFNLFPITKYSYHPTATLGKTTSTTK